MNSHPAGTVAALWRYPVKSMQGEQIACAEVGKRGIAGDRVYALLDVETGFVVSAKHPRKWERVIQCRASYVVPVLSGDAPPPVLITLPDGAEVRSDDSDVHRRLSDALGRDVRLVSAAPPGATREADRSPLDRIASGDVVNREPVAPLAPGTFFDFAPVHVVTTATLRALARAAPGSRFDARRFRPNVVVECDGVGFVENAWIGRALLVNAHAGLEVIDPTPRCVVTTLAQADLPRDSEVLRTLTRSNSAAGATAIPGQVFSGVVGVYALAAGRMVLRAGDEVRIA